MNKDKKILLIGCIELSAVIVTTIILLALFFFGKVSFSTAFIPVLTALGVNVLIFLYSFALVIKSFFKHGKE